MQPCKVNMPSQLETRLAMQFSEQCMSEISRLGKPAAAEVLGLTPNRLESLTRRAPWNLDQAFRVADALGLPAVHGVAVAVTGHAPIPISPFQLQLAC